MERRSVSILKGDGLTPIVSAVDRQSGNVQSTPVENERREDSREHRDQAAAPQPETDFREESGHRMEDNRRDEPDDSRHSHDAPSQSYDAGPAPEAVGGEGGPQGPESQGGGQGPGPGGPMGQGRGGGRRRGGRGRMQLRDRRMQGGGRNRRRDNRGGYQGSPPPQQGGHSHGEGEEQHRHAPTYADIPPDQRSPLQQARAEVDRIRETLEGVLRDLDEVSEQLTRAEHEKDVAETEIEQLRDSLRRLHR